MTLPKQYMRQISPIILTKKGAPGTSPAAPFDSQTCPQLSHFRVSVLPIPSAPAAWLRWRRCRAVTGCSDGRPDRNGWTRSASRGMEQLWLSKIGAMISTCFSWFKEIPIHPNSHSSQVIPGFHSPSCSSESQATFQAHNERETDP